MEHPPHVTWNDVDLACVGVEVLRNVERRVGICSPDGFQGDTDLLPEQSVDVRSLQLARAAAHLQHVGQDTGSAAAMGPDAFEALVEFRADGLKQLLLGVVEAVLICL